MPHFNRNPTIINMVNDSKGKLDMKPAFHLCSLSTASVKTISTGINCTWPSSIWRRRRIISFFHLLLRPKGSSKSFSSRVRYFAPFVVSRLFFVFYSSSIRRNSSIIGARNRTYERHQWLLFPFSLISTSLNNLPISSLGYDFTPKHVNGVTAKCDLFECS